MADTGIVSRLSDLLRQGWFCPVALVLALCSVGFNWGGGEIWNADQMAFKDLFREGALPFSPERFDKPPLYTYLNFFFSVVPREVLATTWGLLGGAEDAWNWRQLSIWLAKGLQLLFAAGSVGLVYRIAADAADETTAVWLAVLLASCAGLIVQAHFITNDLAVVFFMLAAFRCCQRIQTQGNTRDYVFAGLMIGLVGAVKYNGLVIGLALPVFHLFAAYPKGWAAVFLDKRAYLAGLCVPLGFFLGNPFAAIEFARFKADLTYLFATSPEFLGASGVSRDASVIDVLGGDQLGWPLFVVVCLAVLWSVGLWLKRDHRRATACSVAALSIAGFYCVYFAARTNVQVRWLLALVPLLLLAALPAWQWLARRVYRGGHALVAVLALYGVICCLVVGHRFMADPRNDAIDWVAANVAAGEAVDTSIYLPRWHVHLDRDDLYQRMPSVSGRLRLFESVLQDNDAVMAMLDEREKDDVGWYSEAEIRERGTNYVAVSSIYFRRFEAGTVADLYPELQAYFDALLGEELGYSIVFDRTAWQPPAWLYPRDLLFVDNRVMILKRSDALIEED